MARISSGSIIRRLGAIDDPGTAGCLVRFPNDPEKVFWLTAGHVLVSHDAKQFDRVEAKDLPGQTIGLLFGWTSLGGDVTVDAALVRVDPALVMPEIGQLGVPKGINTEPEEGDRLTIFALGQRRSGTIQDLATDVPATMIGPDFQQQITYRNQIRCSSFSIKGCSGAIALDDNNLVVGMVVAGDEKNFTLITPIDEILRHHDWGPGDPLKIVDAIPPTATAPSIPAFKPVATLTPSSALENALRSAVRFNEISDETPYRLSFAGKGASGGSFGFMQGDLAVGQQVVQRAFRGALTAAGSSTDQIEAFTRRLSVPLLRNPLGATDTQVINNALAAPTGRALVDTMDAALFAEACRQLDQCIAKAQSSGRTITPQAQIDLMLWVNMSGPPTTVLDWLSGNDVSLFGGVIAKPGTTVDAPAVERYLKATKFLVENLSNFEHFQKAVERGMSLLGPDTTTHLAGHVNMAEVDQSGIIGAIRDQPITAELQELLGRAAAAAGVDVVRVTSGGQPGSTGRRIGSTRHDGGRAADLELIVDGRPLTFTDQDGSKIEAFITAAAANGATGIGAGERYMGNKTLHVGFGTSPQDHSKLVWGAEGKSVNAPGWLRRAAQQGWNTPLPAPPGADGENEEETKV
jgi:hypothetical protein